MSDKSYEEVSYSAGVHRLTHPRVLGSVAKMLGVEPANVEQCHVLELGCATGSNLLSMAVSLPDSHFVGIDYSLSQIEKANETARSIGQENIEFRHLSITEIDADFGSFDFIIAHGVYSWVPEDVRDKLLHVCKQHLGPNGIAYISHNTYPGWYHRHMVRDLMLYHTRNIDNTAKRVAPARSIIDFMSHSVAGQNSVHSSILNYEQATISRINDSYLLHDYMEQENNPVYISNLAMEAQEKGLQFIGDALFIRRRIEELAPQVAKDIKGYAHDMLEQEQYVDFLRNESFRQSLFTHDNLTVDSMLDLSRLRSFYVMASATQKHADNAQADVYQNSEGGTVSLSHPVLRKVMQHLVAIKPESILFSDLIEKVSEEQGAVEESLILNVLAWLLQAKTNGFIELMSTTFRFSMQPDERPVASPLARLQVEDSQEVANLRQENVRLSDLSLLLLPLLDGTRDQAALVKVLSQLSSRPVKNAQAQVGGLAAAVEENLKFYARAALLLEEGDAR